MFMSMLFSNTLTQLRPMLYEVMTTRIRADDQYTNKVLDELLPRILEYQNNTWKMYQDLQQQGQPMQQPHLGEFIQVPGRNSVQGNAISDFLDGDLAVPQSSVRSRIHHNQLSIPSTDSTNGFVPLYNSDYRTGIRNEALSFDTTPVNNFESSPRVNYQPYNYDHQMATQNEASSSDIAAANNFGSSSYTYRPRLDHNEMLENNPMAPNNIGAPRAMRGLPLLQVSQRTHSKDPGLSAAPSIHSGHAISSDSGYESLMACGNMSCDMSSCHDCGALRQQFLTATSQYYGSAMSSHADNNEETDCNILGGTASDPHYSNYSSNDPTNIRGTGSQFQGGSQSF